MKMKRRIGLAAVAAVLLCSPMDGVANDDMQDRVEASRGAVKALFGALKTELVAAIEAGGPGAAITVCNEKAMLITQEISQKQGWQIARTSLKTRNPVNAPDAWERGVLEQFEARSAAGEDPATIEHHEVVTVEGKPVFRYMKAIPTAEKPCLACHGADIKPEIAAKLDAHYPDDQARGYKAGDIRGAFTISQPLD